ncbi:anti-FecI sigma factor, FecR [Mucilaginibacter paludis DSM 18603]|uniref:Anti-FecI sigma factor, FecR n=2 Tax=Mucilaginibacter TaxID=423349 RepID=H1YE19_9SPHI|nr:anti-FecI sigma factor, FecR [Mucilaginibacter paludis DSM 18603]
MDKKIAEELIKKYNEGTCTKAEEALVESWFLQYLEENPSYPSREKIDEVNQRMEKAISDTFAPAKPGYYRVLYRWSAAAAVLVILSIGGYFMVLHRPAAQSIVKKEIHDAGPGDNKAILTLNNGQQIALTTAQNGVLSHQGAVQINKTSKGEVVYQKNGPAHVASAINYNTLLTPRGGQWKLTLSDGTQVWLNASSSIRYPTVFPEGERKVEITGEAYFEVAKNKSKPFRILSNGQTVEVLGTHFNINAYADEQEIKTTLLEGSVKIIKGQNELIIKPGQQARTKAGGTEITINDQVKAMDEVAWKDGYFRFNNADLPTIMRQFARWYDVKVIYNGKIGEHQFNGKITRQANLSRVLKILSLGGVNFKIEGKQLIVLP